MNRKASGNLAYKRAGAAAAWLLGGMGLLLPAGLAAAGAGAAPPATQAPVPPQSRPPEIFGPLLPDTPADGKGRLALLLAGNRRWCTYPDDRVIRPPQKPGTPPKRNEVFTFGYKFSVSAVKRGQADTPLMLFESPLYRTATWLPASKMGQSRKTQTPAAPIIATEEAGPPKQKHPPLGPDTLVPRWDERNRCVTLPERMDFDLDPGTYDVYVAFDLLNRENVWVHRSTAHLTDIPVESARRTRLEGLVNLAAGSDRQVELETSTLETDPSPSPTTGP